MNRDSWFIRNLKNGWILEITAVILGVTGTIIRRKYAAERQGRDWSPLPTDD